MNKEQLKKLKEVITHLEAATQILNELSKSQFSDAQLKKEEFASIGDELAYDAEGLNLLVDYYRGFFGEV